MAINISTASLSELEHEVDAWFVDARRIGQILGVIKDKQLWVTPGGETSFDAYVVKRFGIKARQSRRLLQRIKELDVAKTGGLGTSVKIGKDEIILKPVHRAQLSKMPQHLQSKVVAVAASKGAVAKDGKIRVTATLLTEAQRVVIDAEADKKDVAPIERVRADMDIIMGAVHDLYAIARRFKASKDRESMAEMHINEVVSRLQSAASEIKAGAGYCECVYCEAERPRERKSCTQCKGRGWLPRRVFDRVSIAKQKAARLI